MAENNSYLDPETGNPIWLPDEFRKTWTATKNTDMALAAAWYAYMPQGMVRSLALTFDLPQEQAAVVYAGLFEADVVRAARLLGLEAEDPTESWRAIPPPASSFDLGEPI